MDKYLTLRNGRKIRLNTPEEDAAITAAALSDPDARPLTDEEWEAVKPVFKRGGRPKKPEGSKKLVSIRLDPDVLDRLRGLGKGWQTEVNGALRKWLETRSAI